MSRFSLALWQVSALTRPKAACLLSADTVEKLGKWGATKIRSNDVSSEGRSSMLPQFVCGSPPLVNRQIMYPPTSFFDYQAHGPAKL